MGLRRRTKFIRPWFIADKFGKDTSVFLDSGAYTINNDDEDQNPDDIEAISEHYQDFVMKNLDRVEMVSEFDAMPLGKDWIEKQRADFYNQIPREKLMVIWHSEWGTPYLHALAEKYEIIGIPATSLNGRNLAPMLNALAANGTRLHGIAMTKIEEMQSIRWSTVSSTSWLSPSQYGDTIVWTGNELKRYPKKYKDEARKRHRTLFIKNGFDADKIAGDDDKTEVLRLSVWSWLQFEQYVNNHQNSGIRVTHPFSDSEPPVQASDDVAVVQPADEPAKELTTRSVRAPAELTRETITLPGLAFMPQLDEDGEEKPDAPHLLHVRGQSSRQCNTCFLAEKCPAYEPDATCAYNIPITVRTRQERKALQDGLLEMQAQRVMFMQYIESQEGGYVDPNLSKEIKLLQSLMTNFDKMEQDGFDVSLRVRGSSQQAESGMISRIFGKEAGVQVQQIEGGPMKADDIIEAELVSETQE